jgi:hypothetical protein
MANNFEQEKEDFLKELNESDLTYETILQKYSNEIRSNKECVLLAIDKNAGELQYASDDIRKDGEFIIKLYRQQQIVNLLYIHDDLKNNRNFMIRAVYLYRYSFLCASKKLQDDEEFIYQVKEIFDYFHDDIFTRLNQRLRNEITKNPDYLLDFAPAVNYKPAKR